MEMLLPLLLPAAVESNPRFEPTETVAAAASAPESDDAMKRTGGCVKRGVPLVQEGEREGERESEISVCQCIQRISERGTEATKISARLGVAEALRCPATQLTVNRVACKRVSEKSSVLMCVKCEKAGVDDVGVCVGE